MTYDWKLSQTLCWDCAHATGGCSWSDKLKPVKGWLAEPNEKNTVSSYIVFECPQFKRDAYSFGLKKLPRDYKE